MPKKDITNIIAPVYKPVKALVVHSSDNPEVDAFIEAYDFNPLDGRMINAHPLSLKECSALSTLFKKMPINKTNYLNHTGLLPRNVFHVRHSQEDASQNFVAWHTCAKMVELFFSPALNIPSGFGFVPPLLWKANKSQLFIFALDSDLAPIDTTSLYKAPFFNIHENGSVCMGNVKVDISNHDDLPTFIKKWEQNFFNSYFSHSIVEKSPIKSNLVQFWKKMIIKPRKFNLKELTIKYNSINEILN